MYHLGIDIGGTFTDVTLVELESGRRWSIKTPSTPKNPGQGFLKGVKRVAEVAGVNPADFARIFHGTTVATNAVLEKRRQTKVGLITTRGFRYVLEIGRHDVPDGESYYSWVKPERPVPPDLVVEVAERLTPAGEVAEPLDEEAVHGAARFFRQEGVEAIAISFLYSYLRPEHERRAAEIVRKEYPEALLALSSDVLPAFREYERTVATALSAYVMPHISRYVGELWQELRTVSPHCRLYIMKSNGGLTSASTAANQALSLVLSGPAGGVMGALAVAQRAGFQDVITLDVGGTSSDIALVRGGQVAMTVNQTLGGLPVSLPMVDVQAVGAGGGSIARITSTGVLQVGPQSAGADPGPICYRQGGEEPTVTDAQVALGRFPRELAGGVVTLDADASRRAIQAKLADRLDMQWEAAAEGIIRIAVLNMAAGIRKVSVERGYDPASFVLVAFGGAGPVHSVDLARELGIPQVLIPPKPGVLSTWGLLDTDLRSDYVRTVRSDDLETLRTAMADLMVEASGWLAREEVSPAQAILLPQMDCRYPHQGSEVTVPCTSGEITNEILADVREAFHHEHLRLNAFEMRHMPVEVVSVRLTVMAKVPRSPIAPPTAVGNGADVARRGSRRAYFGRWHEVPVYDRAAIPIGATLAGPAIIEQEDTTTAVPPGASVVVDTVGNLLIKVGGARE